MIVVGLATPSAVLYLIWRQYARVAREHGATPAEFLALIRNEQARGYARSEAYARALAKLAGARRAVDEALKDPRRGSQRAAWLREKGGKPAPAEDRKPEQGKRPTHRDER